MGMRPVGSGTATAATSQKLITPKNNQLAILGDSITAQCSSLTSGTENYGYITHALRACEGRFVMKLTNNFGVGGDTSTMALDRVPNVIAADVGVCVVMLGTNDRGSAAMTADQTMANLVSIRDQLGVAGIITVFMTPTPRGDTTYTSNRLATDQLGNHVSVRRRILKELPKLGCYAVDTWPKIVDPASADADIKLGYTHDGLHPLTPGAFWVGQELGKTLKTLIGSDNILPVSNADVYHATNNPFGNATVNPTMQGVAGSPATGGTGELADGWSGTNATGTTGVTRTYSKVTTATGDWQQVVIGGVAATANAAVDLVRQIGLQTTMVVGGVYEFVGEYEIDAGMANVMSLQAGVQVTNGATVTLWDGDRYTGHSVMPNVANSGVFRSPEFTLLEGTTDVRARLSSYLSTNGAPVGTIRVRNLALRRVS